MYSVYYNFTHLEASKTLLSSVRQFLHVNLKLQYIVSKLVLQPDYSILSTSELKVSKITSFAIMS